MQALLDRTSYHLHTCETGGFWGENVPCLLDSKKCHDSYESNQNTHTHTTPVSLASPSPQSSAGFPPPKKPTDHHLPNPSPEPEPPAPNPNRSVSSGAGAASGSTCFFSPSEYMDNKCIASLRRPARCGTPGTVCLPPLKKCRRGVVRRRKTLGGLERYFETYSGCSIKTRSSSRSHFQSRSLDPNCGS